MSLVNFVKSIFGAQYKLLKVHEGKNVEQLSITFNKAFGHIERAIPSFNYHIKDEDLETRQFLEALNAKLSTLPLTQTKTWLDNKIVRTANVLNDSIVVGALFSGYQYHINVKTGLLQVSVVDDEENLVDQTKQLDASAYQVQDLGIKPLKTTDAKRLYVEIVTDVNNMFTLLNDIKKAEHVINDLYIGRQKA